MASKRADRGPDARARRPEVATSRKTNAARKKNASRKKNAIGNKNGSRDLSRANRELSTELRGLRERQLSLERTQAHYVNLFDFAPVTYALLDGLGIVLQINLAGCRLLNVDRARLLGRPLMGFVIRRDQHELLEHLRRSRTGSGVVETELRFGSPGLRPITCRLYSKRSSSNGRDVFPTVVVDQTDRLALDQARVDAERERNRAEHAAELAQTESAAKDRFLATVSHELRTPLTPALVAAHRLAAWEGLPRAVIELAATIKRNIEFEARLVDDLLDVASINRDRIRLRLDTIDAHDVIQEAIRICVPIAETKDVRIGATLLADRHHVTADRARLRQVFWNLLTNAIKFSDRGGEILVSSANPSSAVVRVSVRDTGAGMDATVLHNLFAPFDHRADEYETRAGLGLGLAICKGIVAAHRGQIRASSEGPGRGSTFAVELATVAAAS
jgi:signal transduction histidine kinase